MSYLGCSAKQFCAHLESQFTDGMSWENMRLWHIDHIKPLFTFDPHSPDDQAEAWHYTNLRPLWAKDNLSRKRKDATQCPSQ
jgi:hypothetical protein